MAAAIVVVALAVSGGGKDSRIEAPPPSPPESAVAPVRGIPESGNVLGKLTAPVTLAFFGDLQSPTCREFAIAALPLLIHKWVRAGDLRIEYHSLDGTTRSLKTFEKQQVAAYAAGAQEKTWYFIETLFHEQGEVNSGYMTESYLNGIARQVPALDIADWHRERTNPKFLLDIEADKRTAARAAFTETPSFLIGRTHEAMKKIDHFSLPEPTAFNQAIEKLLAS
jgi:protein-disulfide isomerase